MRQKTSSFEYCLETSTEGGDHRDFSGNNIYGTGLNVSDAGIRSMYLHQYMILDIVDIVNTIKVSLPWEAVHRW